MRVPRVRLTTRRVMVAASVAVLVILIAAALRDRSRRRAERVARLQEAAVRRLIRDEPLANLALRPPRRGLPGLLYRLGFERPHWSRAEGALMAVNPWDRDGRLTRSAGPTIDACRAEPYGVPAELVLLRPLPVPDPRAAFGAYSSRSRGDASGLKGVEFYTYGGLDVGIKGGALVAVRVR